MITHSYSHHVDHDEGDSNQSIFCNYIDWNVFKAFKDLTDVTERLKLLLIFYQENFNLSQFSRLYFLADQIFSQIIAQLVISRNSPNTNQIK